MARIARTWLSRWVGLQLLSQCICSPHAYGAGETRLGPPPPPAAQRIVSLAPSVTEIVHALGEGQRIVGVTRFDDYPERVRHLPKVGGFVDPEPEAIVRLQPDLIVAIPTSGGRARLEILASLGLSVVVLPATTMEDLWRSIATLGDLLTCPDAARQLTARLRAALETLRRSRADAPTQRAVLVVGRRPLVAAGPGSFLDGLLPLLNLSSAVQRGGPFPMLDAEALRGLHPEVLIDVSTVGDADTSATRRAASWHQHPGLRGTTTRLITVHDSGLLRLGPRLPAALTALAQQLDAATTSHPAVPTKPAAALHPAAPAEPAPTSHPAASTKHVSTSAPAPK